MRKIRIKVDEHGVEMTAELNETESAEKVREALPIESSTQIWGEEVYFEIPVRMPEQDAQAEVPNGAIAYWPPGRAFCIFFGQEPYSPVNVIGKLDGDPSEFAKVQSVRKITLEEA